MSGVKHTPGPWLTQWEHDGDESIWSRDGGMHMIATCHAEDDRVIPAKANARLIAAAPDLLEALEAHQGVSQLLAELEFCLDEERGEIERQLRDIEEQARAAIARARGEQDGGGE